jgi:hypothetical protein
MVASPRRSRRSRHPPRVPWRPRIRPAPLIRRNAAGVAPRDETAGDRLFILRADALTELASLFPDLAKWIRRVARQPADLLPVVRGGIYHPDFDFSSSIKTAAPALCPDVTYDDLKLIADGNSASTAFWPMASGRADAEMSARLARSLRAYCHRDTWAMDSIRPLIRSRRRNKAGINSPGSAASQPIEVNRSKPVTPLGSWEPIHGKNACTFSCIIRRNTPSHPHRPIAERKTDVSVFTMKLNKRRRKYARA